MTPGELLQDLRDIQLPAPPGSTGSSGFAFEPLFLLGLTVLLFVAISIRRRRRWKAQARALLSDLEQEADVGAHWSRLVSLAGAVSRQTRATLPDCVYLPVDRVGPDAIAEVDRYVRASLQK